MFTIPKTQKILLGLLLMLLAFGCHDGCNCTCGGCTTRKIVEEESETKKIDGIKVRITANKVKSTNRTINIRGGNALFDKSTWYSANYNVRVADRPEIKEICEHFIESYQDLENTIAEFQLAFSKEKNDIAVGRNGYVWDFFHFLEKGNAFPSGTYYFIKTQTDYGDIPNLAFDKIKWTAFPDNENLFDTLLLCYGNASARYSFNSADPFLSLLADMPAGNEHEMLLINNWFNEISALHFTDERVKEVVQVSAQWKTTALDKIFKEIEARSTFDSRRYSESLSLLIKIDDEKSLLKADNLLYSKEKFDMTETYDYFIKRYFSGSVPLKAEIRKDLTQKAEICVRSFPDDDTQVLRLNDAIDILLSQKDEKLLGDFIKKINVKQNPDDISSTFYVSDMLSVTVDKYDKYPENLKKLMLAEFTKYIQNAPVETSQFDISRVFDFLKDKIACEELKTIYKKHKEALRFTNVPDRCS